MHEFDVGVVDGGPHEFGVIVTGIVQDEDDPFSLRMMRPNLVDQLLQGLAVDVGRAPNIQILLIQGTISPQDVVAFAATVTGYLSAVSFLGPNIASAEIMGWMDRIQVINP